MTNPEAVEAVAIEVTQEDAIAWINHAFRNWNIEAFSLDDLEDVRDALQWFKRSALTASRAGHFAEAAGEFETRFWSIVDPNSVPSDMWDALERMASAYRKASAIRAAGGQGHD